MIHFSIIGPKDLIGRALCNIQYIIVMGTYSRANLVLCCNKEPTSFTILAS